MPSPSPLRACIGGGLVLCIPACALAASPPSPGRGAEPAPPHRADDKTAAWDAPLRGAVYAGYYADGVEADLDVGLDLGFRVVRLFFPSQADADGKSPASPGAMTPEDVADPESAYFHGPRFDEALRTLDATIAAAAGRGMRIVISPGLVPGSHATGPLRWRLYRHRRWHREFAEFWGRLAQRYRDNPAVVGYLLLNEPGFEVTHDLDVDDQAAMAAYYEAARGTPADLNVPYRC